MIKKITLAVSLTAILATGAIAQSTVLKVNQKTNLTASTKTAIENIPLIKKNKIKIVNSKEFNSFYIIEGMSYPTKQFVEFTVTKDLSALMLGKVVDAKTSKILHATQLDANALTKKADFTYGNGPITKFVFVDPTCPGCAQFERYWPKLKDKYTFKIFIWSLPGHRLSPAIADYILSAKTDAEKYKRLREYAAGINTYKNTPILPVKQKEIRAKLTQVSRIASNLNLSHTPTVLGTDLKEVQIKDLF